MEFHYCNCLLAGLPQTQLNHLQATRNAAARVVTTSRKTDHITPVLKQLHWLPIDKRIEHKLMSTTVAPPKKTCHPISLILSRHVPSVQQLGLSLLSQSPKM